MENSTHKTMNKLKQLQVIRRMEKDIAVEQATPLGNPGAYLKKQTQFATAMEDAKPYMGRGYDAIARSGTTEDKPKQSQSPGSTWEDETLNPTSETMRPPAQ